MSVHAPHAVEIIERVSDRLVARFHPHIDESIVRALVLDSYRRYRHLDHPSAHARSLAAQLALDRLESMMRRDVLRDAPAAPSFLFICSGNAGRSQLAAAIMKAIATKPVHVMSGGGSPAARILPAVVETLDELGIPIFGEYPKPVTPEFVAAADHIIVLNCHDQLDVLDGHGFYTWSFTLESTSGKQGMRHTRDQIVEAVRLLAHEHGLDPVSA